MTLNQRTYIYIFILLFSVRGITPVLAQDTTDSIDTTVKKDTVIPKIIKKDNSGRHLSFGVDIYHPIINNLINNQNGHEFSVDYYLKNDLYAVGDFGYGGSNVDYNDLKYTTNNNFLRVGLNRSILLRNDSTDWDNMFIGFRLGGASIKRSQALYVVTDTLWGNSIGSQPGKNFNAFWVELNLGVRVQLVKGLSAGWIVSGKFMLNSKSFQDLAPLYIAGFGKGDKNSSFDFDFFITYSISWKRKIKHDISTTEPKK